MDILYFLGTVVVIVVVALGFMAYKIGGIKEAIAYTEQREGKGVLGSMFLAIGVIGVILVVLVALSNEVKAEWFKYTELYAGADYTFKTSPQCIAGDEIDEYLTSNIGVRQHIYTKDRFSLIGNYTHHSCFIGVDSNGYDGAGIQAVYRVNW